MDVVKCRLVLCGAFGFSQQHGVAAFNQIRLDVIQPFALNPSAGFRLRLLILGLRCPRSDPLPLAVQWRVAIRVP